jgi:hypothetical protein
VAELGSAFLCADLSLAPEPRARMLAIAPLLMVRPNTSATRGARRSKPIA